MKLIKLLAVSLVPLYLLNLNNAYTMTSDDAYLEKKREEVEASYNDGLLFYNSVITNNGVKIPMDSLATLNHCLSTINPMENYNPNASMLAYFQHFLYHYSFKNNPNAKYRPDTLIRDKRFIDHFFDDNSESWKKLFKAKNLSVTERLQCLFDALRQEQQYVKEWNPIVPISNFTFASDALKDINENNHKELLEKIINNYLTDKNLDKKDINKITNIFLDISDLNTIQKLYNVLCYGDNTITIGNNTFELAGAALITINKDLKTLLNKRRFVAAKKRNNGKWAIIDSLNEQGAAISEPLDNEYDDLDSIMMRSLNLKKRYLLMPTMLVFRKVLDGKNPNTKQLNSDVLEKSNSINQKLLTILKQLDYARFLQRYCKMLGIQDDTERKNEYETLQNDRYVSNTVISDITADKKTNDLIQKKLFSLQRTPKFKDTDCIAILNQILVHIFSNISLDSIGNEQQSKQLEHTEEVIKTLTLSLKQAYNDLVDEKSKLLKGLYTLYNNTININTKLSANEKQFNKNNNSINNININSFNEINDNNNSININNINTDYNTINNNSIKNNNIKNENNNNRINNQIDKKSNNKNVFFDKSISNTSQNKRISEIEKKINQLQQDIQNAETSTSEFYSNGVTANLLEDAKKTIKENIKEYILKYMKEKSDLADLVNKSLKEQLSYFYREYLNYLCKNINARMKEMGMEFDPNFGPNNEFLRDILQTMFYNYINDHNGILVLFEYDNNTAKPIIDLLKKQDELNTLKQELEEIQNNNKK